MYIDRTQQLLVTSAPTMTGIYESIAWLRAIGRLNDGPHDLGPPGDRGDLIRMVRDEVADTWPRLATRVDWPAITQRHETAMTTAEDLPAALDRWLAELGDAHTTTRSSAEPGRLPHRVVLYPDRVSFHEVAPDSPAWHAGVRPGHRLIVADLVERQRRWGAHSHARPWVVGHRLLAGAAGTMVELHAVGPDGRRASWQETYKPYRSLSLLEWEKREDIGLLRLRGFLPPMERDLDAAMGALSTTRALVVDLRGNGGGNLLMAERFRSRFLRRTTRLGVLRRTLPGGALGPDEVLEADPHETPYGGRVVFVTDPVTYSAAEDCLLGLQGLDHVKVVGMPSGGGSGRLRLLRVLPDRQLSISTALTWDRRRRCVEGHGIPVDLRVVDTPTTPHASLHRALSLVGT